MKNNTKRILTTSLLALVTFFFASSTFAAYEGYLTIKGGKQGKSIKVKISDDGTFTTPPLSPGTYSYSFGATQTGSPGKVGRGISSPTGASADREASAPSISEIVVSHTVKSPRDVATGQSSGKRQHGEVKITKEWDANTPMLGKSSSPILIGMFTVDDDCDGITGTVSFKDASGAKVTYDLAVGKK